MPSQLPGENSRGLLLLVLVNNPSLIIAMNYRKILIPKSWEIMKLIQEVNRGALLLLLPMHEKSIVDKMQKHVIAIERGEIIRDQEKGQYEMKLRTAKLLLKKVLNKI